MTEHSYQHSLSSDKPARKCSDWAGNTRIAGTRCNPQSPRRRIHRASVLSQRTTKQVAPPEPPGPPPGGSFRPGPSPADGESLHLGVSAVSLPVDLLETLVPDTRGGQVRSGQTPGQENRPENRRFSLMRALKWCFVDELEPGDKLYDGVVDEQPESAEVGSRRSRRPRPRPHAERPVRLARAHDRFDDPLRRHGPRRQGRRLIPRHGPAGSAAVRTAIRYCSSARTCSFALRSRRDNATERLR